MANEEFEKLARRVESLESKEKSFSKKVNEQNETFGRDLSSMERSVKKRFKGDNTSSRTSSDNGELFTYIKHLEGKINTQSKMIDELNKQLIAISALIQWDLDKKYGKDRSK